MAPRLAVPNPVPPLSRAGGSYAKAWRRFLVSRVASSPTDIPVARPTPALAGHLLLDEAILAGFRTFYRSDPALVARTRAEAMEAVEVFGARGWLQDPATYHSTPPAPSGAETTIRLVRGRRYTYERLSFDSGYEPHPGEPGRDRWLGYESNRRARVWMLRHDEQRPWLVCVHGARMGRPTIDLTVFRARWLHERLGLNVAFPVQPLHGPRGRRLPPGATYPGEDVLDNVHGAAQSAWDVRRTLAWIREQDPGAPIGLTGVSLGGYAASMVASLDSQLACAILGVPAVDLVDLIERHAGRLADDRERRELIEAAKVIGRVVSPLAMTPAIPVERRYVYAGIADRFVHPRHQVIRLWEHWGRPEIHWYEGGHTLFSRAKPVGQFLQAALATSGLVGPATVTAGDV